MLQSGHLLYHAKANTTQTGVCFLINRKWNDQKVTVSSISGRVADRVLCIIKRYKLKIVKVYAPTTSYSDEDINNFYYDVVDTLGKSNHYTRVMGGFNAQLGKRSNATETATATFGLGLRNERSDTLVEWATSRKANTDWSHSRTNRVEKYVIKIRSENEQRNSTPSYTTVNRIP